MTLSRIDLSSHALFELVEYLEGVDDLSSYKQPGWPWIQIHTLYFDHHLKFEYILISPWLQTMYVIRFQIHTYLKYDF